MLKIVKNLLKDFVSSSEFKEAVLSEYKYILDGIEPKVVEACRLTLDEGDILVFPSSISDADFKKMISMVDKERRVGIVAADSVKIIKVS